MMHPCFWQHNLASIIPDHIFQAVIQPRILKPVKASKYSTSCQIFHHSGTFDDIDTCSATSYWNFDSASKLLVESEARSIFNIPDINARLKKLMSESIISEFLESGKHDFSKEYLISINCPHHTKGSTYVILEASMILQK